MVIRRIMVALDESPAAFRVFDAAVELAQRFGAPLFLFRAIAIPPSFPPAAHVTHPDQLPSFLERQAREQLERLARGIPDLAIGGVVVGEGRPWRAILEAADELGADLIVVGCHAYQHIDRVLGTIAGNVANRAHQNVLVVHDDPRAA